MRRLAEVGESAEKLFELLKSYEKQQDLIIKQLIDLSYNSQGALTYDMAKMLSVREREQWSNYILEVMKAREEAMNKNNRGI